MHTFLSFLKATADLCHCTSAGAGCSGNRMHTQDSPQGKKFKREIFPVIFIAEKLSTYLTLGISVVTIDFSSPFSQAWSFTLTTTE